MEPPISFGGEDVRDEKVRVLHAVPPLAQDEITRHVVRAQYAGYASEPNVDPKSRTETFVAMRLFIDNWRWAGVPFYLRTGKRLPRRVTEVAVQFKRAPLMLFRETPVNGPSSVAMGRGIRRVGRARTARGGWNGSSRLRGVRVAPAAGQRGTARRLRTSGCEART